MKREMCLAVALVALAGCGGGETSGEGSDAGSSENSGDAGSKDGASSEGGSDGLTLPSGKVLVSASTGQYSRQGGSNRDNDFSCNYAVKDADFELPEGSSHYDSARITLEFNTDPGCLGPVGGITPPKTVTLTTGSKIRDGINDKQGTFGQTRFEATFSADDLSVASEANCCLLYTSPSPRD